MKKVICALLMVLVFVNCAAVFGVEEEGNSIFDLPNRFEVIEIKLPDGYYISSFNDGMIHAYSNDKSGMAIFDLDGNVLIEGFDYVGRFASGIAPAKKTWTDKYGYIDKTGKFVISPIFESADEFSEGLASVHINGRNGYIDKSGGLVILFDKNVAGGSRFSDGVANYYTHNADGSIFQYNFIDMEGNILFSTDYMNAQGVFSDGLLNCYNYDNDKNSYSSFFIDKQGNKVFDAPEGYMPSGGGFIDGLMLMLNNDRDTLKIIDKQGNVLAQTESEEKSAVRWGGAFRISHRNPLHDTDTALWLGEQQGINGEYKTDIVFFDLKLNEIARVSGAGITDTGGGYAIIRTDNYTKAYLVKDKLYTPEVIEYPSVMKYVNIPGEEKDKPQTVAFKVGDNRVWSGDTLSFIECADLEVTAFTKDDRIMVPVRRISEQFKGWMAHWDLQDGNALVVGDKTLILREDDTNIKIREFDIEENDYTHTNYSTDVAPTMLNDRIFLPLRAVSGLMDKNVFWYEDDEIAVISDKESISDSEYNQIRSAFYDSYLSGDDYPRIDGSTATIPYSAALTAKLLNININDANYITSHSRTTEAYKRLADGEADMLLVAEPTPEHIQIARDVGVELEAHSFAKEAFVFLVNKDNPVDSLTSEQVRDIYSGKITNWKEVGGNDAPIIAYQRNEDAGSQGIMKNDFMKDTPLMEPITQRIQSMSGLIDVIAEFDGKENSIGYSVYYYVNEMYNKEEVKVIKLDGVEATNETVREGLYPVIVNYSVVIRTNEPQNSRARRIMRYVLSDEGQKLVLDTGFVSVK